jgi:hypothetical protein
VSGQVSTAIITKATYFFEAHCSTRLFSFRQVLIYTFAFCASFFVMNIVMNAIRITVHSSIDIPLFWPISVFIPRIPNIFPINSLLPSKLMHLLPQYHFLPSHLLIALCYAVGLLLAIKYLDKIQRPYLIYLVGFCTILAGNLIQGFHNGFIVPICGGSIQYYHDAVNIGSMLDFISNYNVIQPELLCHARTHPPGAVLTYYVLNSIYANPAFISIALMGISLLSVFYLYDLISMFYSQKTARSISLMFIFLPAVQIYFLSALDSFILLIFTAIIYHYYCIRNRVSWLHLAMLTGSILISLFLTYLAIFPIALMCLDSLSNRKLKPLTLVLVICLFAMLSLLFLNFNYIEGFFMASKLENPSGFRLLSNTASYIITRIENVGEIILFFGPLSSALLYRGIHMFVEERIKKSRTSPLANLSFWGILLIFSLFLAGVARTGETARCCIFIYPLMLVFIAHYLEHIPLDNRSLQQLIFVLGVQGLLMQIFGFYFW